jgi:hypothetical protein
MRTLTLGLTPHSIARAVRSLVPALDLNFADMGETLDARVTFARASNATRYTSAGLVAVASSGVARFTHDPVTLAAQGLLIEKQVTNEFPDSSDFSTANWARNSGTTVTSAAIVAPDGATTGWAVNQVTNGATTGIKQNSVTWIENRAVSFYIKAGAGASFIGQNGLGRLFEFNLTTPAITSVNAAYENAKLTDVGGGWYRFEIVQVSDPFGDFFIGSASGAGSGATFYLWEAQFEAGGAATSQIPTGASSATRLADSASMTGANFSSWYNAAQGTFLAIARIPTGDGRLCTISDGTANNRLTVRKSSTNLIYEVIVGGATQASISVASPAVGATAKIAFSFIADLFRFAVNGSLGTDDTAGTVPTVSQMNIGADHAAGDQWNEAIARIRYFNRALPAATLQNLTA